MMLRLYLTVFRKKKEMHNGIISKEESSIRADGLKRHTKTLKLHTKKIRKTKNTKKHIKMLQKQEKTITVTVETIVTHIIRTMIWVAIMLCVATGTVMTVAADAETVTVAASAQDLCVWMPAAIVNRATATALDSEEIF